MSSGKLIYWLQSKAAFEVFYVFLVLSDLKQFIKFDCLIIRNSNADQKFSIFYLIWLSGILTDRNTLIKMLARWQTFTTSQVLFPFNLLRLNWSQYSFSPITTERQSFTSLNTPVQPRNTPYRAI
ncbi:unnamed protein product [Blepharisma stoltei]|uniref:Uncharacterized protein n=1 Tax=Blepharisma stoltei TaxID=1481888 RepID=A0AAU9J7W1_9CILI|nr:unnamed protein product [Blepharisma stoltei]